MMKNKVMLVALFGLLAVASVGVLGASPMVSAQSASSTGASTDLGSAASGSSASFVFGDSSSSSAAGGAAACASGAGFSECRAAR